MINLTEKTIGLFSQKTKGKILQESLLLFNEQTFNQTTTASIAKSSNVLEGSLWYHFKSKKDLLVEHIKLFESSFKTNIENLLSRTTSLGRLRTYVFTTFYKLVLVFPMFHHFANQFQMS